MTLHLNKRGLLLLLLLLAVAGLTSWLRTRPQVTAPTTETEAIRQIDFFMEDFSISQYTLRGRLHYTFKGRRLDHYEADDRTEITAPDMEYTANDKQWIMRAEQAVTTRVQEAEEIRFSGNVRVEQADSLLIRSETLLLRPETEYMETLAPVAISGNGADILAGSLRSDLRTGVHTLTEARGRYVP